MEASYGQFFNAKVLLFGEYSLLCGSMALSIPFNRFHGRLVFQQQPNSSENKKSNQHIGDFLNYLEKLKKEGDLAYKMDTDRLAEDAKSGLYFESNIPQGYGLGSSGALVAAIFTSYGEKLNSYQFASENELLKLKAFFANLESFFHGKSSGLDPMISFLNQALLITGVNKLETFNSDFTSGSNRGAVFIIDSGTPGETQPLVMHFRKMYEDQKFRNTFDNHFIPLVNDSIRFYVSGERADLLNNLKKLSAFQMQEFNMMIPDSVKENWQHGLDTNQYYLKLCGSGGGGMVLGFTDDFEAAQNKLSGFSPIIIHRF